ncbi:Zn-ribbon domain-containing OB-fold protein [Natronosalvus halobius]|uniref:Zn-ribbon domain-containing OB-fold protein n=1 Tax=Natronosalvus halobius TaxID=2953746 RepID=UPI0020A22A07|nr:zinc ribbon domain-containing protein [Natronosalvus halobius]USZ72043.1 zinc ribbon domain-containing protein [Natronosalvus halobius]
MSDTLPDPLTHAEWTAALRDGRLLGQRCGACGNETAAPKAACNECGSREIETVELPTEGTVYTETTIAVAPAAFEGGYRVAVIDLGTEGNARVTARLESDADIGDAVAFSDVLEVDEPVPVFG